MKKQKRVVSKKSRDKMKLAQQARRAKERSGSNTDQPMEVGASEFFGDGFLKALKSEENMLEMRLTAVKSLIESYRS